MARVPGARRVLEVDRFETPEAFLEMFRSSYGPTIAAYRGIADDPDRVERLDRELVELARRHDVGAGTSVRCDRRRTVGGKEPTAGRGRGAADR